MPRLPSPYEIAPSAPGVSRRINTVEAPDMRAPGISRALSNIAKLAEQEADQLSEVQAEEKLNKLREKRLELSVGENGFGKLEGGAVIDRKITDEYPNMLTKEIEALGSGMNGLAQKKFRTAAERELTAFKGDVYKHAAVQGEKYKSDVFDSSMKLNGNTAAQLAGSEEFGLKLNGLIAGSDARVDQELARRGITDPMLSAEFRNNATGHVVASGIKGLLDKGFSSEAMELLKAHKGRLSPETLAKLEPVIQRQTDFDAGVSLADEAMKLPISERDAFITKGTKGNKQLSDFARQAVGQKMDFKDKADREVSGSLTLKYGSNYRAMMKDPLFMDMDPDQQSKLYEHAQAKARSDLHFSQGQADRARAENNRKWDSNPAALARFEELAMSESMGTQKPGYYTSFSNEIGPALANKLESVNRMAASEAGKYQIPKELINDAIPESILKNKGQTNAFRGVVTRELLNWKELNPGKKPNEKEINEILLSGSREYKVINDWFNADKAAYKLTGDDATKAMPLNIYRALDNAKIPDERKLQWVSSGLKEQEMNALLKSGVPVDFIDGSIKYLVGRGGKINHQEIIDKWNKRNR